MASSASGTVTATDLTQRIGITNEAALAYVREPDPRLDRLSARVREELITEVPAVTAGALLGRAALARHFVASAATGRYRDLFGLWELFSADPDVCRPVLQERTEALERARAALESATVLGLRGHADRVAEDVLRAKGLIWQWLRAVLDDNRALVAARPQVASAVLQRDPDMDLELPDEPDTLWLREAAAARTATGPLAPPVEQRLRDNAHRLPATIANLEFVREQLPHALDEVLADVDLNRPDIGAVLAWSRDHGVAAPVVDRIVGHVVAAIDDDHAAGLAAWWQWREAGVDIDLPDALRRAPIDTFDLTRPETAVLLAARANGGENIAADDRLASLVTNNRQLAEKAYEALVCAGIDVQLPAALEDNPMVRDGARCPACRAWTWVRPGHERRCPRLAAMGVDAAAVDGDTADGAPRDRPGDAGAGGDAADDAQAPSPGSDATSDAASDAETASPDPGSPASAGTAPEINRIPE
ncbi:MAG TPA: hypothetical protein VFZ70_08680 [Euzebyales bacterium]